MKKFIFLVLFVAFLLPVISFADTVSVKMNSYDPMKPQGSEWIDENPPLVQCSWITPTWQSSRPAMCYDISQTNWYKNMLRSLGL